MEWVENEKGKQYSMNTQGAAVSFLLPRIWNSNFTFFCDWYYARNDEIGVEPFVNLQWLDQ